MPETAEPSCPSHLDATARAEWRRLVKQPVQLGLMSRIDRAALACCCQLYSRWVKAEKEIQKSGEMIESPNGYPMASPWVAIANTAIRELRQYQTDFGMNPASRTRLQVTLPSEPDPLAELLDRGEGGQGAEAKRRTSV